MENKAELNKQRNSNIELLRILSMFFIVLSHYAIHGNVKTDNLSLGFNRFLLDYVNFGKLGVAIFVMITGYYMSKSRFKISRIINVILQTLFYSATIYIIMCITDHSLISPWNIFKCFFPVINYQYWFVTAYIVLVVFMPLINLLLEKLTKRKFRVLLFLLVFWYSFAPFFLRFDYYMNAGDMSYMIMFYCIGAYFRYFPDNWFSKKNNALIMSVSVFVFLCVFVIALDIISVKLNILVGKTEIVFTVFSPVVLVLSASLLSFFVNLKPHYSKIINIFGGCVFGVYLIHENNYLRDIIWNQLFDNSKYAESPFLILHMLISVVIVFVACSFIEYVRKYILVKYIFKRFYNRIFFYAEAIQKKLYEKL